MPRNGQWNSARGFSHGKGRPSLFCPEGAWEIEPVALGFDRSIGKGGQPSRLASFLF